VKNRIILAAAWLAATAVVAIAQAPQTQAPVAKAQAYAGQQARSIASLSTEELQAFLEGRGMGLAKAAELNGYPGPMHVLELAEQLKLTSEQRRDVKHAFERMKARATDLGAKYVSAEKAVDEAFRSGNADAGTITRRVAEANRLLGEVRLSHLIAHLEITPLLTPEQRARYAELRGYGGGDQTQHKHKH
jgi:Spy/CpxP family protein refolding chaperone